MGSQTRPRLGILPFTGGMGGDGEAIAALLTSRPEILAAFTVVPITDQASTVIAEHQLQMTAFTDSDAIANIGRILGADYVISGHMRRLGNRNLVIATVINVETLELVAGYYRTYRNFREVRGCMPSMSRSLVNGILGRPTLGQLPSLAIAPLGIIHIFGRFRRRFTFSIRNT